MSPIIIPPPSSGGGGGGVSQSEYRTILRAASRAQASIITGAGIYVVLGNGSISAVTASSSPTPLYLDPAAWSASGLTTRLRLLAGCLVTATAPAITFTWGLYPVTGWAGATTNTDLTLGAVVAGSTVAIVSPAANSLTAEVSSGDFTFPAAGFYIVGFAASGAPVAASNPTFPWALQVRNT